MTRAKKRKHVQDYDPAKAIDMIAKTASRAVKLYKTVEPILKAIRTIRRKTK
jgi:hypothetical protein